MKIPDINPWWKTSTLQEEFSSLPKRNLYKEIAPYIGDKQIIAINGLRRTGKTVLMHHIIDTLLKKHSKEQIFYFSFDLFDDTIENILSSYGDIVGLDTKKDSIFIFLDEVQKHHNWENEIKALYDNYRNIKFFISGSSSLFIEKRTKESLGGRVFSFVLEPLTFNEYLKLKKVKIEENLTLYEKEIKEELNHYMRTGGFPELLYVTESTKIDRYIKELIIDRVSYIDIPRVFEIDEPELLVRLLSIISASPGMIIEYENLANDLSRNRKTISNYVSYLEKAFLIKKIYNYSKNLLTSEKKLKKVYPASTAFSFLFNAELGNIIENTVLMNDSFKFFSRKSQKEVDFIKTDKTLLPVEVKYKKNVKDKEIKSLLVFAQDQNIKKGYVITESFELEKIIDENTIYFIPLWKWLLIPLKK